MATPSAPGSGGHGKGGDQAWDKGVQWRVSHGQARARRIGESSFSSYFWDIRQKKAPGEMGVVEEVKEAATLLVQMKGLPHSQLPQLQNHHQTGPPLRSHRQSPSVSYQVSIKHFQLLPNWHHKFPLIPIQHLRFTLYQAYIKNLRLYLFTTTNSPFFHCLGRLIFLEN